MSSLLAVLRDMLILRRGPQDLPYSLPLLVVAAVASVLLSQWAASLAPQVAESLLLRVVATLLLHMGLLYVLLNAVQRQARFVQTASAFLLVDVLFTAIALPLLPTVLALMPIGKPPGTAVPPEAMTGAAALASLLFIAVGIWRIAVDAHILRQALEIRLLAALLINVALLFAGNIVIVALFGAIEGS